MGFRPSNKHSLDRINNDGNYEPNNCKWSTDIEQSRNKRNNCRLQYGKTKMILIEWGIYFGVTKSAIGNLLKNGWEFSEVVEYYCKKYKKNIHDL